MMEEITDRYEAADVPIYRVSLYRMTPFMIVLAVYRRIFKGVWLSACRMKLHPFMDEHIRVQKGLPQHMEADVIRHEINHGKIALEDVVPEHYMELSVAPLGIGMATVMVAGLNGALPEALMNTALQAVIGGGFAIFLYRLHKAKTLLEEAVNDDIDWEQYKTDRAVPNPVKAGINIVDNWLHTLTAVGDGMLLMWATLPRMWIEMVNEWRGVA